MTINGSYIDPFTLFGGLALLAGAFLVFMPWTREYLAAKLHFKLTRPLLWIGIAIGFLLGYQAAHHGVDFGGDDSGFQLLVPAVAALAVKPRTEPLPTKGVHREK